MLQITEDTPPDMLAGAMDLTVHLPTGRTVKMSVERSTPMMDLLVQITTHNHLQLSGYTLQVLGMAPSKEHSDSILPYKPNTPIGTLDTQHIRVVPKARTVSVPKNVPPGHQPFESTFRLKVHLPRNQLYVTRVGQSVHLGDIMKKVCEEKILDPLKYEFRHPGNLDEILDPKLTLSDYAITEIYLVQKGTGSLNQAFSSGDIMALRKEEERKQMHNKTGGGVFNLIFRRGKSSTGSLSSDNRSISPTHSDDSRSVTPPGVQQQIITSQEPPERPKPPQRKRRPAPKPPQDKPKVENGLTICHSRNSSDSSGYHEASILSDNNTSLPRRPKSTMISEESQKSLGVHSHSTSNLSKMSAQSKSTSSLAVPSRKKKSAPPPPPPVLKPDFSEAKHQEPSPVVASQPCIVVQTETHGKGQESLVVNNTNPIPTPRTRTKITPSPRPRSIVNEPIKENKSEAPIEVKENKSTVEDFEENNRVETVKYEDITSETVVTPSDEKKIEAVNSEVVKTNDDPLAAVNPQVVDKETIGNEPPQTSEHSDLNEDIKSKVSELAQLQKEGVDNFFKSSEKSKAPEIVALYPKPVKSDRYSKSIFDSYTRKRGFQIGSSLLDEENSTQKSSSGLSTPTSVSSALNAFDFVDEIEGLDVEMFTGSLSKNSKNKSVILNELHGMHELENLKKNPSRGSLRSVNSLPGFTGTNMKKWNNVEELDEISLNSNGGKNGWVLGDTSDTESLASSANISQPTDSLLSVQSLPEQKPKEVEETTFTVALESEPDWQYQLPSPPKAFRDSSPADESIADSVVTSPELFEKLKAVKDTQSEKETASDVTSMVSEDDKPILNKLSLENLEKRKSLVYNRELTTTLKEKNDTFSSSLQNFEETYNEVKRSSPKQVLSTSTLPNFKITTYNNSKQKLDIFEDDTVRSNSDKSSKRNSFAEPTLEKSYVGRSMENISFRKNSLGRSDDEYKFFKPPKPKNSSVFRSESFSREPTWVPTKPVARSKSQVALNKYKDTKNLSKMDDDSLTKSSSLFDVSGLQSLGVMRLIQNKLNTPNNSTEQLDCEKSSYQEQPEIKIEVQKPEGKQTTVKTYRPPSINMGTWSERPKIPVNVKDDPDYKSNTSKLIVNTVNNDIKSHNSIEVRNKTTFSNGVSVRVGPDTKNVSIKVNGVEPQAPGNVVIKIGGTKPVFRKPLGNVNENQRPHSIAFGGDFDISRVPIVRSVEFKKPYKEVQNNNNTSITQINNSNNAYKLNGWRQVAEEPPKPPPVEAKRVFRVKSFVQNSAPVVRGFRNNSNNEINRASWNQPHSFSTLPAKPAPVNFAVNAPIPFSQKNLRRTESATMDKKVPPPAPVMPKTFSGGGGRDCGGDPRDQLLQAIRDFGGKKGLRAVKA
ncbi:cordon-bleu protein-like 1 isoform X2 [Tribolium madens]|nr:cordon-bleu protein-like 1 isoform X2 [Tribolium madens]XP_044267449.1 cordon-bleu protein-like 1 isoform X2 [Tribolium madens]